MAAEPARARNGAGDARPTSVRLARAEDVPALTRLLVRAYIDDPVAVWVCGSQRLRAKVLAAMYSTRLHEMLAERSVWTDEQRSSVAVWTPPECVRSGMRPNAALLRCFADPRLGVRAPLLAAGFKRMQRSHPRGPAHWYLSLLGTDPHARGRGLGSAMLQPVLERCDRDRTGAYLESSKPRNLDFYARLGFHTVGELRLPGGPKMWPMWREPNTDRSASRS
jgi:ribosomal protein S18 acetylase RimI-like enzyme